MLIGIICVCIFSFHSLWSTLTVSTEVPFFILIDADNGRELTSKNPDTLIYPASTTKIATALYVLSKKSDLGEMVFCNNRKTLAKISPKKKSANHFTDLPYLLEYDGTSFGVRYKEEIELNDLLHALLISSSNDVANILAEHTEGGVAEFCDKMNEYMRSLGLKRTHFVNPHGLHHPEHVSTPRDMALLAKHALNNETLRAIVGTSVYTTKETNKRGARTIVQTNKLLCEGPFRYPLASGLKTGSHARAGKCLLAAAGTEERRLIGAFFKAKSWNDCYSDAIALFDAAFREKKEKRVLFAREETAFFRSIAGAKKKCKAYLPEDVALEYYPSESPDITAHIAWLDKKLPIAQDEVVAYLEVIDGQSVLMRPALLASSPLEKPNYLGIAVVVAIALLIAIYFFTRALKRLRK